MILPRYSGLGHSFDGSLVAWYVPRHRFQHLGPNLIRSRADVILRKVASGAANQLSNTIWPYGEAWTSDGTAYAVMANPGATFQLISVSNAAQFGWYYIPAATGSGILHSFGAVANSVGVCLGIGSTTIDGVGGNVCALFGNIRHINTGVSYGGAGFHHIGYSLGGGNSVRIYLDGKQIYNDSSGAPVFATYPAVDYTIFGTTVSGTPRICTASCFDSKLWSRNLSDAEVALIYRTEFSHFSNSRLKALKAIAPPPSFSGYTYGIIM